MKLITVRFAAHEWPDEQVEALFSDGLPEFIIADRLAKQYIGRIWEWFTELNLMLVRERGVPVGGGRGIPIRWDGRAETLASGY